MGRTNLERRLLSVIERIERVQVSPQAWFFYFYSLVLVRNFAEMFSSDGSVMRPSFFFLETFFFYCVMFLANSAWFRVIAAERLEKVSRVYLFVFLLAFIPPVFDLLASGGAGHKMAYFDFNTWEDFRYEFFNFYWAWGSHVGGATPGIRLEMSIAMLLGALYVWLKTRSPWRTVLAPIVAHCLLFAAGSAGPGAQALVELVARTPGLENSNLLSSEQYSYFLFIPLLFAWGLAYSPGKLSAVLKNLRVGRLAHYLMMLLLGIYLGLRWDADAFERINLFSFVTLLLSVTFAWWAAVFENDLRDIACDQRSNPGRPLASGILTRGEMIALHRLFTLMALLGAFILGDDLKALIFISIYLAAAHLYSSPPLHLKRFPFIATFTMAFASLVLVVLGSVSVELSLGQFPARMAWFVLVIYTCAFTAKDLKDHEGDRQQGVHTLMTLLGPSSGRYAIGGIVALSYGAVPLILGVSDPLFLGGAILAGALNFLLIIRPVINEKALLAVYFCFAVLLVKWFPHAMPL